jgi:Ni2+-binding GTPase involved in maturation of urease and hydrogenase
MRLIPVGGFLGAGKTTLLWEAARRLSQRGHSVGLVTNDQVPGLVDTALLSRLGSSVREVAGSCFCCNFNGLADAVDALANEGADCVLAEPVGSCTDLSATILQPVKALYPHWRVSPLSVLVDPLRLDEALRAAHPLLHADAAYILRLQLEEADQILLNKVDTLSPSEYERQMALLAEEFPGIPVKGASALNGQGIDDWLESVLSGGPAGSRIAPVDYDRYANGEAALGWLNVEANLSWTASARPDWAGFMHRLLGSFQDGLKASQSEVGHIKMLLDSEGGRIIANLTGLNGQVSIRSQAPATGSRSVLTLNARAQVSPERIEELFRSALKEASAARVASEIKTFHCIQPGRPQPTHRFDSVVP